MTKLALQVYVVYSQLYFFAAHYQRRIMIAVIVVSRKDFFSGLAVVLFNRWLKRESTTLNDSLMSQSRYLPKTEYVQLKFLLKRLTKSWK